MLRRVLVVLRRVRALFEAGRADMQLDAEIRDHLDSLMADHMRRGLAREDARAAARRDFGGVDQVKEQYRDQRVLMWLDTLARDVRFGVRSLKRSPTTTAVIVLTLAVGVGVNTAIFSVVNAVVLKPFAYADARQLVVVHELARRVPAAPPLPANAVHFEEWRRSTSVFEQLAIVRDGSTNLTGSGEPERLTIGRSSANLFAMLGVRLQLGRNFLDAEDRDGRDRVVILSDGLWRRRFGADVGVIGRQILLDDRPFVVVGVLPPDFRFPQISDLYVIPVTSSAPDLWKPFGLRDGERTPSGDFNYACIGKLRPGVTVAQAVGDLDAVQSRIDSGLGEPLGLASAVVPLSDQVASRSRAGLWLLLAAAGVVLFIGCVNVAGLLLGRTAARRRELTIRRALGATTGRLINQLFIECAVLCAVASVLGVFLAYATTQAAMRWAPADLPQVNAIALDVRVLMFALGCSIAMTIVVGAVPAWRSVYSNSRRHSISGRSLLVVAEISISTVCLVAAALLLHGFSQLMRVDKGFDADSVALVDLTLSTERYPDVSTAGVFVRRALERLAVLPGVSAVGVVSQPPLAGIGANNTAFVDGASLPLAQRPVVDFRPSSVGYFSALRIPLREGRLFDEHDGEHRVAVISATAAARFWPAENALGKTFRLGRADAPSIEVVGVVGDIHGVSLSEAPSPTVYLPYWQRSFNRNRVTLAVRTTGIATATASAAIRGAIHKIDPQLPVPPLRTMSDVIDTSTASRRFQRDLLLAFALMALVLVSLGTYGVISYSVSQRAREIGIRLALGAMRGAVLRSVLTDAMKVALAGLALGLPLAVAAASLMRSLLFGVSPADVTALAGAALALTATALAAAFAPALRASRVNPAVTLRYE
jgi:putative ABC transport system permease protein